MAKKQKKPVPRSSKKKKSSGGKEQLTKMDMVIAGLFIGSIIYCVAAFSTALHPLNELFIIWPLIIGAVAGALVGLVIYLITKFESMAFMVGVLAISGALVSVAFVLTFGH